MPNEDSIKKKIEEQTKIIKGGIGGKTKTVSQTPTVTVGAYSALDAIGGLLTFADIFNAQGGTGVLHTLIITDLAKQSAAMELWLFDRTFTADTDNAVFDVEDTDLPNCIGVIPIATADWFASNDSSVACVRNIGLVATAMNGATLYGQLKAVGTPTYASVSDLTIKLVALQD